MSLNSVSSTYLATAMLPSIHQAQSQLTTLEIESSTGQYADLGLQLGSQSGYELSLKNQYDQMQTLTTDNAIATTTLPAAQSPLDTIRSSAQSTLQSLSTWTAGTAATTSLQS